MLTNDGLSEATLSESDLVIESWGAGHPTMDGRVTMQRGVRITHKPTGVSGESDYYKSQLRNKEEALALLRHRLAHLPSPVTTLADDVAAFEQGYRASARLSYHDKFARCPECGNATVGYSLPWAINHQPDCKAALALPEGTL